MMKLAFLYTGSVFSIVLSLLHILVYFFFSVIHEGLFYIPIFKMRNSRHGSIEGGRSILESLIWISIPVLPLC